MNDLVEFGTLSSGEPVQKITIGSGQLRVSVLTLGAIIQDVRLKGIAHSLTIGSDDIKAYEGPLKYYGAIVGPVANRIAGASTEIEGTRFSFEANENGITTLHSGTSGTHAQLWTISDWGSDHVDLCLNLKAAFGGFPGNRELKVSYRVTETDTFTMAISGTSDAQTPLNLANHSYWALDGLAAPEQRLIVHADRYLAVDENKIPTHIKKVDNTPFDLRATQPIGSQSDTRFDHNFCLTGGKLALRDVAVLSASNGLSLYFATTEPGLQVYDGSGNQTAPYTGHQGVPYYPFSGVALEAQIWPDAVNRPEFPSVMISPEDTYQQITQWRFKK